LTQCLALLVPIISSLSQILVCCQYCFPSFFFLCYFHQRDLHSFPTRRSSDLSSPSAVAASLSLRIGLREDERYRFFASCWVMVLAPRSRSRCRHAARMADQNPWAPSTPSASATSAGSIPTCERNRESSAMITIRWRT